MRGLKWFALVVGLAVLVAASVEAGERGGRRGRGKEAEQSVYDLLVTECKLTDSQQTAVKAKIKAKEDALAAWNTANAEQKVKWQAFQLYQTVMKRFRKVEATAEQTAKIKTICAVASKELSALEGDADDKAARKERSAIDGKLRWAIENVILTPEQRAATAKKPCGR